MCGTFACQYNSENGNDCVNENGDGNEMKVMIYDDDDDGDDDDDVNNYEDNEDDEDDDDV